MTRYDLTDEELALMEPLSPPQRPNKAGHPSRGHRQLLHGIFCILGTDAPWPDLAECYVLCQMGNGCSVIQNCYVPRNKGTG